MSPQCSNPPPQVPIWQDHDELDLSDVEGLDPEIAKVIQEKAKAKAAKNRKYACRALTTYQGLFQQMYGSLSTLTVPLYLMLFSVTDAIQQRLVRSKMSTIFKPNVRQALDLNTSDSSQGVFVGVSNVLKNLEESKKINILVKVNLLQTKKIW